MLYIVATPIGNMKDITLRALEILENVDIIAAEDTRHTSKLLAHYNIKKPLISYFEHNKIERGPQLIARLIKGENIALVSDAGMPGISDPGEDLVKLCIENNVEYTVCPGPVAGITALVLSGLSTGRFTFEGFLPEDKKKLSERLDYIKNTEVTTILYESPHNIIKTIKAFSTFSENRTIVLCRELTKKFEEVKRGTAEELLADFETNPPRGEYVVVVEGAKNRENSALIDVSAEELYKEVCELISQGKSRNSAIKGAAEKFGIARNVAYDMYEEYYRTIKESV